MNTTFTQIGDQIEAITGFFRNICQKKWSTDGVQTVSNTETKTEGVMKSFPPEYKGVVVRCEETFYRLREGAGG